MGHEHSHEPLPTSLTKFALLSVATALTTMGIKTVAAWLTGSISLLSDAAESIINLVAAVVTLFALRLAAKPADEGHPFGHSKAEYLSAAVEGAMILVAAGAIIWAAIERLITPRLPEQLGIGMLISVVAALINGGVALVLIRAGRAHSSSALVADGKHLMTDLVTTIAVLVGVGLVWLTGWAVLDPIVAILAGLNILYTGYDLIRDSASSLLDAALGDEDMTKVHAVLDAHLREGITYHALRSRVAGTQRFLDLHISVPGEWSVAAGHALAETLSDELSTALPRLQVSAHVEPSRPDGTCPDDAH
ncbi:MAG: cation diffusion facilitator family transporter [Propionibacteriaceae bacterium]|jgi:cation diffusion facilitator family transporter|nr:cation diffusion facilitator family transporter [Propionibacteriaceae bacterium]